MPNGQSRKTKTKVRRMKVPMSELELQRLARSMIQEFGSAAASRAIEMVRKQTRAGNRAAALKWHQVMSLIEKSGRKL